MYGLSEPERPCTSATHQWHICTVIIFKNGNRTRVFFEFPAALVGLYIAVVTNAETDKTLRPFVGRADEMPATGKQPPRRYSVTVAKVKHSLADDQGRLVGSVSGGGGRVCGDRLPPCYDIVDGCCPSGWGEDGANGKNRCDRKTVGSGRHDSSRRIFGYRPWCGGYGDMALRSPISYFEKVATTAAVRH